MIRIHVTAAAYAAIAATLASDSLEPQRSSQGGFFLWLDKVTVNQLAALRGAGESYSEAILRLSELEGAQ
jgi:hypothetical protein